MLDLSFSTGADSCYRFLLMEDGLRWLFGVNPAAQPADLVLVDVPGSFQLLVAAQAIGDWYLPVHQSLAAGSYIIYD